MSENPGICSACRGKAQYYMVKNNVWLAANPTYTGPLAYDPARSRRLPANQQGDRFLCFTCLESRLGRPLTREDFTDALVNQGMGLVLAEHHKVSS
jgi:hypothetical protein